MIAHHLRHVFWLSIFPFELILYSNCVAVFYVVYVWYVCACARKRSEKKSVIFVVQNDIVNTRQYNLCVCLLNRFERSPDYAFTLFGDRVLIDQNAGFTQNKVKNENKRRKKRRSQAKKELTTTETTTMTEAKYIIDFCAVNDKTSNESYYKQDFRWVGIWINSDLNLKVWKVSRSKVKSLSEQEKCLFFLCNSSIDCLRFPDDRRDFTILERCLFRVCAFFLLLLSIVDRLLYFLFPISTQ